MSAPGELPSVNEPAPKAINGHRIGAIPVLRERMG